MKKIWKYLKHHLREDFSIRVYVPVALMVTVLIVFNYITDFEDTFLDARRGMVKWVYYFLFYSIPYYVTVAISFRGRKPSVWTTSFLLKSFLGLAVMSLDASLPFIQWLLLNVDAQLYLWAYKVTVNMVSVFTVVLPLYLYYRFAEKERTGFYGLSRSKFDSAPYFKMLLIMLPLLIAATWLPGFLRQYPMYKVTSAHEYLGVSPFITALAYELAYGFDFVSVELLFRGFMVIGMSALLGRKAVLAMAVIYCLLHFGKPAGEAISSVFGGYILGVIAFETRSIWGGIIVHLGIAWMMELIAFIAKQI